jgi:hypothetical protein
MTWCLKLQERGNVCGLIGTSATVCICVGHINQVTALQIDGIANGPG